MDDTAIFGSNKRELRKVEEKIKKYLKDKLNLELNKRSQLFKFDYIQDGIHYGRDLDFMGYRFFSDRTILRRNIYYKGCRKARRLNRKKQRAKLTSYDCKQMITYFSWFKITNTYHSFLDYIKGKVDYQKMKKKIGRYDRRMNKLKRGCI